MEPPIVKPDKKLGATDWVQQEMEDVFSRLTRYTRFVLFGKWFLAGISLLILLSLMAWPLVSKDGSGVRISFVSSEVKDAVGGVAPVMENPRFQGVDKKGQPYIVTAARAIQQSATQVTLEDVKGELSMKDQNWLTLTAKNGEFRDDKKILYLLNGVTMRHPDGYLVITDRAAVDTVKSTAYGDRAVQAQGPMGNLLATGFEIRDNGNYLKFGQNGRVNVQIRKSQKQKRAS